MTAKQIKKLALIRLKGNWGNCISMALTLLCMMIFVFLAEYVMCTSSIFHNNDQYYSVDFLLHTSWGNLILALQIIIAYLVAVPESYVLKRLYYDISKGGNYRNSRNFFEKYMFRQMPKSILANTLCSIIYILTIMPCVASVFGIYYIAYICQNEKITTIRLLLFMFAVMMLIIFICFLFYIRVSLRLVPYIIMIYPNESVTEAISKSFSLMRGNHILYLAFQFSFLKYMPLNIFVYPILFYIPFYSMSKIIFIEHVLEKNSKIFDREQIAEVKN